MDNTSMDGHSTMDNASMEHKNMNHEAMEHENMDHEGHEGMDMEDEGHVHQEITEEEKKELNVGITEKLGQQAALDAVFKDSEGNEIRFGDLLEQPVLVAPVYYSCPNVCNFLQSRLAQILPDIKLEPIEDYKMISISFDEYDTPEIAANKKKNYFKAMDNNYPKDGWLFLSGDKENIDLFMDSIGFRFDRRGKDFVHAVTTVAISPEGKIARYLYGTDVLPFEFTLAATEAAEGKVGLSVQKLVRFCFSYDPQGQTYVFNILRVTAVAVIGFIIIFVAFLYFGGKKSKRRK
ncbi:SCO family protein [Limisalsivibrio acetivorans]|uniref:SCO family protein n=1 Tax=Limisalsivibrio acetivorans TaxID=1304888 RepID=UPI0003B7977B|nr:SCO family protein [Limisalsivibrio acetivorans]